MLLPLQPVLLSSQNLNLYECTLRQLLDSHCRTSRIWLAEELGVNLIHGCEIVHAVKIYSGLHYVREVGTSSFQDVLGVGERLTGLLLDTTLYEITCGWVDWNLPRCEYETVYFDSLAIWTDSCRRIVCVNCVHFLFLLIILVFVKSYAKIMQTSAMKACFQIAECNKSYAKIHINFGKMIFLSSFLVIESKMKRA